MAKIKNSLIITGVKRDTNNEEVLKKAMHNIIEKKLGLQVEKGKLKGRPIGHEIYIDLDETLREREVQREIRKITRKKKANGPIVKIKYQKLEINEKVWIENTRRQAYNRGGKYTTTVPRNEGKTNNNHKARNRKKVSKRRDKKENTETGERKETEAKKMRIGTWNVTSTTGKEYKTTKDKKEQNVKKRYQEETDRLFIEMKKRTEMEPRRKMGNLRRCNMERPNRHAEQEKKKEAWKQYKNSKEEQDRIEYSKHKDNVKIIVRKAKRTSWKKFEEGLDQNYRKNMEEEPAIIKTGKKAGGADNIDPEMIKWLEDKDKRWLLEIMKEA
ncbi:hypothetical protein ILUMI_00801 [Ignelater luminosus]|uniref:Uncharacterized protein n=1 Tax=Ignelater luminosus TaxID=2038154 RepID=A0A8K0GPV4_IGNLU|nr:hypothetical protein ILUMI_00801 [Ignelater luminosus]